LAITNWQDWVKLAQKMILASCQWQPGKLKKYLADILLASFKKGLILLKASYFSFEI